MTGWFERLMNRIPIAIASALLAGVLTRFGLDAFAAAQTNTWLVVAMLVTYLLGRRLLPRYAVMFTLAVGTVVALLQHKIQWSAVQPGLTMPVFTMPSFSWQAAISLALPLFVVTMASQNLPGVAIIRGSGYDLPISKLITMTGLATLLLAPFGAFGINLAAITAAICMGREAGDDPARRYTAAVAAGLFYGLAGLAGGAVVGLLQAFPRELVLAVAGLALLGTMASGLVTALKDETHRDAAALTFLVTLSGVSMLGIGSAFWGVVVGTIALLVQQWRAR
jgi:benzoate membrane transport protein